MGAKSAAHTVAVMATTNRNSTTTDHQLEGSAEGAVIALVAETATVVAAAALSLVVGRRASVLLRGLPLAELEDDWDLPGRSKANLVEAAKEEFAAEFVAARIGCSICIGCR